MYNICNGMAKTIFKSLLILQSLLILSCNQSKQETPQGNWINGSKKEQLDKIENQFRGFDMAMVETGYRYNELYWAGQDENWEYADYQLKKIKLAIENGLERRPKRAESATNFLKNELPEMEKVIEKRNKELFNKRLKLLTHSCNSCHAMEDVPFFNITIPINRHSPIKIN